MKKIRIMALISAVITAILLFVYLGSLNQQEVIAKRQVLVAAVDIAADTPITAEMLATKELPIEAVLAGAFTDSSQVIGKVSSYKFFAGEQIIPGKLLTAGEKTNTTLAYVVEPGMRAITIPVSNIGGLAYMIKPGDHVDLLGEFLLDSKEPDAAEGEKISYTVMVMEDVDVLAVDNILAKTGSASYATLTLQVTPEQAMTLSMATYEGQLRAIMRSPLDEDIKKLPKLTLKEVMAD